MMIESIGTATPPFTINLEDRHRVAELYVNGDERDRWFVPMIYEKSTVERRHCVFIQSEEGDISQRQSFFPPMDENSNQFGPSTAERMMVYEEHAPELAYHACENAFAPSWIDPAEITHLVTASCTGFTAPGFDIELIGRLGMSSSVERTHLGFMGCHAGLNCLRVANAFAVADPNAKVLICATELCGLHYQYVAANDQKVANALFGDGSGAAIVVGDACRPPSEDLVGSESSHWKLEGTGSCLLPASTDLMSWRIRDNGFTMGLSDQIPDTIKKNVPAWFDDWLQGFGLKKADIKGWAVHPGGPQILNAFEQAMDLREDELMIPRGILRSHGNMSSATIFFVLQKFVEQDGNLPCVAVGFGPGLTLEATLFVEG